MGGLQPAVSEIGQFMTMMMNKCRNYACGELECMGYLEKVEKVAFGSSQGSACSVPEVRSENWVLQKKYGESYRNENNICGVTLKDRKKLSSKVQGNALFWSRRNYRC